MPLRDSVCHTPGCNLEGVKQEHYYHNDSIPMRPCLKCGSPTEKVEFSTFKVVFTGPISRRYNDPSIEGAEKEGHWAYRKKTLSGKPEPVWISDFGQQREFCRSEGLANPTELPRNMMVGEDGKTVENTRGMPGTEI